jgi:MerR family transcriptional regulator, copper efflux regulator
MTDGALDHVRAQESLHSKINLIDARIASPKRVRKLAQQQLDYCRAVEAQELAVSDAALDR